MKKMLTLSFDDGTIQDRQFVGLLNKYGFKCTFNLNSGFFGQVHDINHLGIVCNHDEIQKDEVASLYAGHEIAVHTVTHPNLTKCDDETVISEINDDRLALQKLCGYPITGMAYPGGPYFDDRVIALAKTCRISWARTTNITHNFRVPDNFMEWNPTCWIEDPELFDIADGFLSEKEGEDCLFYVWGHSFEFSKFGTWDRVEKFLQKMAGREDVVYLTNGEVYRAVTSLGIKRR